MALAAGVLLRGNPLQGVAFLVAVASYLVMERAFDNRTRLIRAILAAVAVLVVRVPLFMWQTPTLFEVVVTVIEVALTAVLSLLFYQAVQYISDWSLEKRWRTEEMLSMAVTIAVVLLGIGGISIMGLSAQVVVLNYLIMLAACMGGATWGTAMGVAASAVLFLAHPLGLTYIGVYAFSGLIAGSLREWRKIGVIVGFTAAQSLLLLNMESRHHLLISLFACLLSGLFLFMTSSKSRSKIYRLLPMAPREEAHLEPTYASRLQGVAAHRLRDLCQLFMELSYTFSQDNENKEAPQATANKLMDRLAKEVCEECAGNVSCWGKDFYRTYQSMLDVLAISDVHGTITRDMMPEHFRRRCSKITEMQTTLNSLVELYRQELYWEKRLGQTRELVGRQLQGVSGIMSSLAKELNLEVEYMHDREERIVKELGLSGIFSPQVEVVKSENGRIEVTVTKHACNMGENHCVTTLIPLVTQVVGRQMSKGHHRCAALNNKAKCTVCLSTAHVLSTETGFAQVARSQGICGDSYRIAEISGGKLALMVSDGMGDGPLASKESRAAINLLEQMLKAGFDKETTIQTVNSVLALRSDGDTFATVDMLLLDLYSGSAEMIKIGASSSFIRRKDKVEVLRATTLPAGILNNVEVDSRRIVLLPGDILVMLSDGVLDGQRGVTDKEEWLSRILRQASMEKAQDLAEYIINRAQNNVSGQVPDDMTVVVLKVLDKAVSIPLVG
jgi:stage II sporulation protein E